MIDEFGMPARLLLLAAILFAAFVARDVILLGFFSIVLAVLISFPVNFMNRFVSRGISVLLTLLAMLGIILALVVLASSVVSQQVELLKDQVPTAAKKVRQWVAGAEESAGVLSSVKKATSSHEKSEKSQKSEEPSSSHSEVMSSAAKISTKAFSIVINFAEAVSAIILVTILALFLVYDPEGYRKGVRLFVPKPYEKNFDEVWRRISIGLKHWVGGIFIEMLIMGTFAGVGLWIAGIDGALVLGLLTFLATFIPYLGAVVSSVPGLLMGLAKSPHHLLYAAVVYLCVHILEGYIVSPYVMKHAIQLRPALLLFWQALMGTLFGIIGIIVATPLLACLKALVGYSYVECKLGKEAPRV